MSLENHNSNISNSSISSIVHDEDQISAKLDNLGLLNTIQDDSSIINKEKYNNNNNNSTSNRVVSMRLPDKIVDFDPLNASSTSKLTESNKTFSLRTSPINVSTLSSNITPSTSSSISSTTSSPSSTKNKKLNLSIRSDDETRIVNSLNSAAKKITSGSIFSIVVNISINNTLDIGVKDLQNDLVTVYRLKRTYDLPGAGESAGIRLGDIIFGINFIPLRNGSKTLMEILTNEIKKKKKFIHIQAWRCHQLCSDPIPGYQFYKLNDMFLQSYSLYKNKILNNNSRWNLIQILLDHMVYELDYIINKNNNLKLTNDNNIKNNYENNNISLPIKNIHIFDLEKNIFQAKLLRSLLNIRILHTKIIEESSIVLYIIRIEDIESGLSWLINKRYSEFLALYEELIVLSPSIKELEFPSKRMLRITTKIVEERIKFLEYFLRKSFYLLVSSVTTDINASKGLELIHSFLNVNKYINCLNPPPIDEQRSLEIIAYQFLNDYKSVACQKCIKFVNNNDIEKLANLNNSKDADNIDNDDYIVVLEYIKDALQEVEDFVRSEHEETMLTALKSRLKYHGHEDKLKENSDEMTEEEERELEKELIKLNSTTLTSNYQITKNDIIDYKNYKIEQEKIRQTKLIRQCIRRQVESAIYLPLRRIIFRILQKKLLKKNFLLQKNIQFLSFLKPDIFHIDPIVHKTKSFSICIKNFRRTFLTYLPVDMSMNLIQVANSISDLYFESKELREKVNLQGESIPSEISIRGTSIDSDIITSPNDDTKESNIRNFQASDSEEEDSKNKKFNIRNLTSSTPASPSPTVESSPAPSPSMMTRIRGIFSRRSSTSSTTSPIPNSASSSVVLHKTINIDATSSTSLFTPPASPSVNASRHLDDNDLVAFTNEEDGMNDAADVTGDDEIAQVINFNMISSPLATRKTLIVPSTSKSPTSNPTSSPSTTLSTSPTSNKSTFIPSSNSTPSPSNSSSTTTIKTKELNKKLSEKDFDPLLNPSFNNNINNNEDDMNYFSDVFNERLSQHTKNFALCSQSQEEITRQAISADDFLPLFTYLLVQCGVSNIFLLKEIMHNLIMNEDIYGECGYYLATLEASIYHIIDLAKQYENKEKEKEDDILLAAAAASNDDIYEYTIFTEPS